MFHSGIIINQIIILGIMILVGVVATKFKVIDSNLKDGIASLIFNITLPLLIITTYAKVDLTRELIGNAALVLILAASSILFLFLLGSLSSKFLKLNIRQGTIHIMHTMFGNSVFLGFPLLNALFPGGEALFYGMFYFFVSNTMMWTLGVYILGKENGRQAIKNLKNLINPNSISFVGGIAIMLSGIAIPEIILKPLSGIGEITNYLSMLYIGAMLANTNIRSTIGRKNIYLLSLNKLLLGPGILAMIFTVIFNLFNLHTSSLALMVVILQAGMPCMTIVVIMAKRFRADDKLATENIFVSTILSLATLPMLYFFVQLLLSIRL